MNIHEMIKSGIPLASDEGTDTIVMLEDETGDLVAYVGHEDDYEEEARHISEENDDADLADLITAAEELLDEVVDGKEGGEVIEGEAEEA